VRLFSLTPFSPSVICDALARRGVDPGRAAAAARGLTPAHLLIDELDPGTLRLLADTARRHRVDLLTGERWALVSGSVARLAGLTRAGASQVRRPLEDALGDTLGSLVEPPEEVATARGTVSLAAPVVVGILNVTPDSFSDGGRYAAPDAALRHAEAMVGAGAGMIDIGGESTRPGATPVSAEEEWSRVGPVLREVVSRFPAVPVSVDTVKAATAARALDAGAWFINDVSALRVDPKIASLCAESGAGLILMHSRGEVGELASYAHARYDDVVESVVVELGAAVAQADERGVPRAAIVVDPGLGFSKKPEHNYAVLRGLRSLLALGRPVMIGPSRKRFLAEPIASDTSGRDRATAAACVVGLVGGASLFRVHAVADVVEALRVAQAIKGG
jgi:dihydropteroate synthase